MNNKNLKPFKKGSKRASDAGKKSKTPISLTKKLREFFEKQEKEGGQLTMDNYIKACVINGIKGNSGINKELWERLEGKVPNKIEAEVNHFSIDPKKYAKIRKKMLKEDDV